MFFVWCVFAGMFSHQVALHASSDCRTQMKAGSGRELCSELVLNLSRRSSSNVSWYHVEVYVAPGNTRSNPILEAPLYNMFERISCWGEQSLPHPSQCACMVQQVAICSTLTRMSQGSRVAVGIIIRVIFNIIVIYFIHLYTRDKGVSSKSVISGFAWKTTPDVKKAILLLLHALVP